MLILCREKEESIMIGDGADVVEVMVVDVCMDGKGAAKVRLGIKARKSIPVRRKEIYEIIQREKAKKQRRKNDT